MKTAEQIAEKLWEKHAAEFSSRCNLMTEESFLLACREFGKEYGEAVRQKAAGVAREQDGVHDDIYARAIERMELP